MSRPGETKTGEVQRIETTNTLLDALLFDFDIDSFELKDEHRKFLNDLIAFVQQSGHGPLTVSIDGFASRSTGSAAYNKILSENREQAVENFLRTHTNVFDVGSPHTINRTFHGFADSPLGEKPRFRSVRVVVHRPELPPPPVPVPKDEGSTEFQIKFLKGQSASLPIIPGGLTGERIRFLIIDPKRRRKLNFIYEGKGNSVSFFSKGALTFEGPPTPFRTTKPATLGDFEGKASVGAFVGTGSVSMKSRLSLRNVLFFSGQNSIVGRDIEVTTGPSFGGGLSIFSATDGELKRDGAETDL